MCQNCTFKISSNKSPKKKSSNFYFTKTISKLVILDAHFLMATRKQQIK